MADTSETSSITVIWAKGIRDYVVKQIETVETNGVRTGADVELLMKLCNRLAQVDDLIATFAADD